MIYFLSYLNYIFRKQKPVNQLKRRLWLCFKDFSAQRRCVSYQLWMLKKSKRFMSHHNPHISLSGFLYLFIETYIFSPNFCRRTLISDIFNCRIASERWMTLRGRGQSLLLRLLLPTTLAWLNIYLFLSTSTRMMNSLIDPEIYHLISLYTKYREVQTLSGTSAHQRALQSASCTRKSSLKTEK